MTGFRSGVADKLGLGHDELAALNPRLVYVHAPCALGTGALAVDILADPDTRAECLVPKAIVSGSIGDTLWLAG